MNEHAGGGGDGSPAVARNRPCPCGSGRRFKDCCGSLGRVSAAAPVIPGYRPSGTDWASLGESDRVALATMMETALRQQQSGDPAVAAALYREVLAKAPETHDAWHMLGVVELGFGRLFDAENSIRRALALRPEYPAIKKNLDLAVAALRARDRAGDVQRLCAKALPLLKWRVPEAAIGTDPDADATGGTRDQRGKTSASLHFVGGVGDAGDDADDSFVIRLAEFLPEGVTATYWHDSLARRSAAARRTGLTCRPLRGPDAFPLGGTLVILDAMPDADDWLERACPDRVVLFCGRGSASHYLDLVARLNETTATRVELVFSSATARARFGLPGRVCVTPVAPPESAFVDTRGTDGRFVVGGVSDRDESTGPRESDKLWRDLAQDGARILLRGANRLREALGHERDIEFRSRQIESLPAFASRLSCLVYHVPREWHEGRGNALFSAMALGVPVVCASQSQYAEYIEHDRDGLIVASEKDAREAVAKLRRDPGLAGQIGAAARQKAARMFSPAALAAQYAFLHRPAVTEPSADGAPVG